MIEIWHNEFNPMQFLSCVNIDLLVERNIAYNESSIDHMSKPCIMCGGTQGPGLLLNDKTYLCKVCLADVFTIRYPEKYETLHRQYLRNKEARSKARAAFIQKCQDEKEAIQKARINYIKKFNANKEETIQERTIFIESNCYRQLSVWAIVVMGLSLIFIYYNIGSLVIAILSSFLYFFSRTKYKEKLLQWDFSHPIPKELQLIEWDASHPIPTDSQLVEWDLLYPLPPVPQLKHFHDPTAELTHRDEAILKVFNNWPGYPLFWDYLREIILRRDKNRCQVSGCPSRVELHIHHKIPVSLGGEHVPTNLITLCSFHHALEPEVRHEIIWSEIKTSYFTMVRAHKRHNRSSKEFYNVRAHVRRLELIEQDELFLISGYYGFVCSCCFNKKLKFNVDKPHKKIDVICSNCGQKWIGNRQLAEETGPRLAEVLHISRNKGTWAPRWDMLEEKMDSTFILQEQGILKSPSKSETVKAINDQIPKCPRCGNQMQIIRPKKTDRWKEFWGCSNYRQTGCSGKLNI